MKTIRLFALIITTSLLCTLLCACDIKLALPRLPFFDSGKQDQMENSLMKEDPGPQVEVPPATTPAIPTTTTAPPTTTTAPPTTTTRPPSLYVAKTSTYKSTKTGYFSEPYVPSLVLRPDGTFTLTENLAAGMGTYEGDYFFDNNMLFLMVKRINFGGFAGDNVSNIYFKVNSATSITLETNLCLSGNGDVFQIS